MFSASFLSFQRKPRDCLASSASSSRLGTYCGTHNIQIMQHLTHSWVIIICLDSLLFISELAEALLLQLLDNVSFGQWRPQNPKFFKVHIIIKKNKSHKNYYSRLNMDFYQTLSVIFWQLLFLYVYDFSQTRTMTLFW